PGAAAVQLGLRPFRVSPYSVNWLTTSSGAFTSEHDFSSSRIRRPHSFEASFRAFPGSSSWVTPTRTISPGPSIAPTIRPSTDTLAWLTRWTTARMVVHSAAYGSNGAHHGGGHGRGVREVGRPGSARHP